MAGALGQGKRLGGALALLIAVGSMAGSGPPVLGGASAPVAAQRPQADQPVDPAVQIEFDAELVMPHFDDIALATAAVADPASPDYRHYLSASAFGQRFGLSLGAIAQAAAWFNQHGLTVTGRPANRTELQLRASAGQLERVLGAQLVGRTDAAGVAYHRLVEPARVPADLAPYVSGFGGLDTSPASRPQPHFGPANGLHPVDLAKAYGIDPLRAQDLDGSGQSVAVVSFDTFDPQDIAAFDRATGISGPAIESIRLSGAPRKPGDSQDEVSLDLETIRAMAPKAQIYDYEAPQSANWSDIINRIVEDHKVQIVSISWGLCEPVVGPRAGDADDLALASAELSGLSIFVSSGDAGAYDCLDQGDGRQRDFEVAVDYPSVSPHVIAVGGTYLSLHQDGSYLGETAWQDPLGQSGSGGGLSHVFARPAWQAGPGVSNSTSNGKRQVPDVAGPADPASGMFVVSNGQAEVVGGTSAATPFWAGSMVLAAQLAAKDGITSLGFLDPTLYAVAAGQGADGNPFHDVTVGANLLYPATPGWDFATGWGSPQLSNLVPAIVAYLQAHPD
ncbi:MAG: protease pro-enzyme activation domain-containing protein [Candidatus Limnocylindrales bacterium]